MSSTEKTGATQLGSDGCLEQWVDLAPAFGATAAASAGRLHMKIQTFDLASLQDEKKRQILPCVNPVAPANGVGVVAFWAKQMTEAGCGTEQTVCE